MSFTPTHNGHHWDTECPDRPGPCPVPPGWTPPRDGQLFPRPPAPVAHPPPGPCRQDSCHCDDLACDYCRGQECGELDCRHCTPRCECGEVLDAREDCPRCDLPETPPDCGTCGGSGGGPDAALRCGTCRGRGAA